MKKNAIGAVLFALLNIKSAYAHDPQLNGDIKIKEADAYQKDQSDNLGEAERKLDQEFDRRMAQINISRKLTARYSKAEKINKKQIERDLPRIVPERYNLFDSFSAVCLTRDGRPLCVPTHP